MEYMEYKGTLYDVGTVVIYREKVLKTYLGYAEGTVVNCTGTCVWVKCNDEIGSQTRIGKWFLEQEIKEIVKPVYPQSQKSNDNSSIHNSSTVKFGKAKFSASKKDNPNAPPSWKVEIGWIWYILIMAFLTITKQRIFGWIVTTIIFFAWKSGAFNNKKK